jgi:hypothetical protein
LGGGSKNYISGSEGSQAVPASPTGIGDAYDPDFLLLFLYDAGMAAS